MPSAQTLPNGLVAELADRTLDSSDKSNYKNVLNVIVFNVGVKILTKFEVVDTVMLNPRGG